MQQGYEQLPALQDYSNEQQLYQQEEEQYGEPGVRFSYDTWPTAKVLSDNKTSFFENSLGILVQPLVPLNNEQTLEYPPLRCKFCGSVLNPLNFVDYQTKIWNCCICLQRNVFPQAYQGISSEAVPQELYQGSNIVEYTLGDKPHHPMTYIIVIDICVYDDELENLKEVLNNLIGLLPDSCLVGIVTFGSMVYVHELGSQAVRKSYIFRGTKEANPQDLAKLMGIQRKGQLPKQYTQGGQKFIGSDGLGRFLIPANDFDLSFIDDLQSDKQNKVDGYRAVRCTGAAISVASSLLDFCVPESGARIMLFTSGPCTDGPGKIVNTNYGEAIRTHQELIKNTAEFYKDSKTFYDAQAQRLTANAHALDVFACSLDQVGLAEMQTALQNCGGYMVMAEEYKHEILIDTLEQIFKKDSNNNMLGGSNAILEIKTSDSIKVTGCLGPCNFKEQQSEQIKGLSQKTERKEEWLIPFVYPNTTFAVYFDLSDVAKKKNDESLNGQPFYVQYQLTYTHVDGSQRLRVITTNRYHGSLQQNIASFDQDVAIILLARLVIYYNQQSVVEDFDSVKYIDKFLIALTKLFSTYQQYQESSLQLHQNFAQFPQYIYHLRRSQLVQVFNNSPDETTFFRTIFLRESLENSLTIIQPLLIAYQLDEIPQEIQLDVRNLRSDWVLVMDGFFTVVVHIGTKIASWRDQGFAQNDDFQNLRDLLNVPIQDAKKRMQGRIPVPRYVLTDQAKSQARFLLAKLNPSVTQRQVDQNIISEGEAAMILTDDVSFETFWEYLAKLIVNAVK